jgi:hypothetical protein
MVWRLETSRALSLTRPKKSHEGNHPLGRIASLHGFEFYLLGYCLPQGFLPRNFFFIYEISNQFKEIIFRCREWGNPAKLPTLEYMISVS